MLRFFRRIRQRLLAENRVSKYMLYAIGEIVLVVIGILIALQIDNWNQQRLENIEEQKLVKNLLTEFESNLTTLDTAIYQTERALNYAKLLLDDISDSTQNMYSGDRLDSLILLSGSFPIWLRSELNIRALEASGNLNKLGDENLKNQIYAFMGAMEKLVQREEQGQHFVQNFIQYVRDNASWREIDKLQYPELGESTLFPSNDGLMKDFRFENRLNGLYIWNKHKLKEYRKIRIQLIDILNTND